MMIDAVRPRTIALIAGGCLLLSILFFAPRLWLMRDYVPGSFQWDRAHTFLLQCEQPLRRDIEPAMLWRLLPPLVAHTLHLPGRTPLVLPWLGIAALAGYVAVLHARRLPDARFVFGGTLLCVTTSAVLVPVGWLGMNDAWVWLGLLVVAFGRAKWAPALACLLCPWVDERFIIGFPLAWLVARLDRDEPLFGPPTLTALWLLPYAAIRLAAGGNPATGGVSGNFVAEQVNSVRVMLPLVPLGWWMGLRAGWLGVAYAGSSLTPGRRLLAGGTLGGTLLVTLALAADLSRSTAIVLPAVLLGGFALARRWPEAAPRLLLCAGCANLLIPAAHVVRTHLDPISPLPIELFRLLR